VVEHGRHGLLFRAGDVAALERGIVEALRHPARMAELAGRALERVKGFSEERMVDETVALFDQLAPESAATGRHRRAPRLSSRR
jgi:glycosyltransferase involved in cell wall biosynthesis